MKKIGITNFRKDIFKEIEKLKKGEKLEIMKKNETIGVFIKK